MVNANGNVSDGARRLKVLIVGGGICGLTCGAALREFADVTILESAPALGEVGAAVHLAPNAHRLIKALGGDLLSYGAMPCTGFQEWRAADNTLVIDSTFNPLTDVGCEWALCHRVDVQQELRRLAIDPERPGAPCKLILGSVVVDCNPETATVTTAGGDTYQADVLIGADGLKSVVRAKVVGEKFHSQPSGHSAYRVLIPAAKIEKHPQLSKLGLLDNRITLVNGGDRRIICYPTRHRTLLNFVCALPDSELHEISEEKWSAKGDPEALVRSYATFDPIWQELLRQTEDCGLWQLRDQDPLEDWVKGRTIIVGDAAHSRQGASQAIEDGEAIGACLRGVDKADVPQALQRIFGIRYKRATYTQQISRSSGLGDMRTKYLAKLGSKDLEDGPLNPQQYRQFSWNYFGALEWERNHQDWLKQEVVD